MIWYFICFIAGFYFGFFTMALFAASRDSGCHKLDQP